MVLNIAILNINITLSLNNLNSNSTNPIKDPRIVGIVADFGLIDCCNSNSTKLVPLTVNIHQKKRLQIQIICRHYHHQVNLLLALSKYS